jgi:ribosomal-protein-alanine N-acetyltransferase
MIEQLTTQRMLLQPLKLNHSRGMFELWSQPEVCVYSGRAEDRHGDEIVLPARYAQDSDRIIDFFLHRQAEGSGCRWALIEAEGGAFLGIVGFNAIGQTSEIAYHLHPKYWGQGYMREACIASLDWLHEHCASSSLEAYIDADNVPSQKLALGLGMQQSAAERDGSLRFSMQLR